MSKVPQLNDNIRIEIIQNGDLIRAVLGSDQGDVVFDFDAGWYPRSSCN